MSFGEIIKVTYVGRPAGLPDTIDLLRRHRLHDQPKLQLALATDRKALAKRVRLAKKRLHSLEISRARQRSSEELLSKLFELTSSFQSSLKKSQHDSIEIALKVATEVLASQPEALSRTIQSRISREFLRLHNARLLKVTLNPADVSDFEQTRAQSTTLAAADIVACADVLRGNAVLHTAAGSITLDWRNHLVRLEAELKKALMATTQSKRFRVTSK